jgi:hypothetical protein
MVGLYAAAPVVVAVPLNVRPVYGVIDALALLNPPMPSVVTAATLNRYAVPLVSPVTVMLVNDEAEWENVFQVLPLSLEYWTV